MPQDKVKIQYQLVADEIDRILSHTYGEYLVSGRPTKHGGLRFLDINSAKTFGFERTKCAEKGGNLVVLSAPYEGDPETVKERLRQGPAAAHIASIEVRPSPDPGKEKKMFVEISFAVPTDKVLANENILKFAETHNFYTTSEISKRLLHDFVVPMARSGMDHLIEVIRELSPAPVAKA